MKGLGINESNQQRRRDDDALAGAPWPVRAIVILGTSTAIACYLVWFLSNDVRGWQKETGPKIDAHVEATKTIGASLAVIEAGRADSSRRMERLLQVLCVQGAKTREAQRQCFPE